MKFEQLLAVTRLVCSLNSEFSLERIDKIFKSGNKVGKTLQLYLNVALLFWVRHHILALASGGPGRCVCLHKRTRQNLPITVISRCLFWDGTGQDITLLCLSLTKAVRSVVLVQVFTGGGLTGDRTLSLVLCVIKWTASKKLTTSA